MPDTASDLDHESASSIVVVPVGSYEQHGPHLPSTTDTQIAVAVCEIASRKCTDAGINVVIAPAVTVSASDEHVGFAGTLSIGTEPFAAMLVSMARSASWARGIVFANGHGGNSDAIAIAMRALADGPVRHAFWTVSGYADTDSHAGFGETSLMLHIAPDDVRLDRAEVGNTEPLASLMPLMRTGGVRAVSRNGVLGDPRGANAAEGERLLARNAESLAALVADCDQRWRN